MNIRIIADSCCDMTSEHKRENPTLFVPFIVRMEDGREYIDDEKADVLQMLADIKSSARPARSTCPAPEVFATHMQSCEECFVVTISSQLSGCYNSACVARDMVREEHPEKKIHIFDSLSAVVAETRLALFLHEKVKEGLSFESIIPMANRFIKNSKTFFVLEDLGNLFKNGRLMKAAGHIAGMLRLCPVMGEDGAGNIKLVSPSLGIERSLRKLVDIVAHQTEGLKENSVKLFIGFCNCTARAEKLKEKLLNKCKAIGSVELVPTGILSSMYANDQGIVIAF